MQDKVRTRLGAWRRIGAPRHVLRWLREGVRADWLDGPPAPFHFGVSTFTPEERVWLTGERDRCLGTGAWRRATCFDFVSRAFIVTHNGKRRLVIDFRHINLHHVQRGCRFESLARLRRMARRGDWMFSIDLKDAYHHLGVHSDDQHFFTFAIQTADGTEYFSASALSFGWCMSPWYFTQLMKPVVSYFRNPTVGQTVRFGQREPGPLQTGTAHATSQETRPLRALRLSPPPPPRPLPPLPLPTLPPGLGLVAPVGAMRPPVPVPPPDVPPTPDPWADVPMGAMSVMEQRLRGKVAAMQGRIKARFDALRDVGASNAQVDYAGSVLDAHISAGTDDPAEAFLVDLDALIEGLPQGADDEALADALADSLRPRRSLPGAQSWRLSAAAALRPRAIESTLLADYHLEQPHSECSLASSAEPPSRAAQRRARRSRGPRAPRSERRAEMGCRVLPWLDDFAFFKQGSYAEAVAERDHVFATLEDLGLSRSPGKGQPEPSHCLEDHLGYGIDTVRGLFLLTAKREAKLRGQASALLGHAARHRRHVRTRVLAGFAGLANASSLAVPLARFWLRSVHDDISSQGHKWSGFTRLSRQAIADINEWRNLRGSRHVGRAIWLAPDSAVGHVDAGPYGWGGQLDYQRSLPPARGFWSAAEAELHITFRELRAVRLFIETYVDSLRGRRLLLYEDNQAVVAILTNRTTKSPLLMAELRALMELLAEADVSLRATYIRSAANKVADYFSRLARPHEYAVAHDVFRCVCGWWGECTVDAFAGAASALLQRYWAEAHGDDGAEAIDAFAQEWEGERLWVHPPPHLLPQVAQLLRERPGVEALVCTPFWPGEAWYGELLSMCEERTTFAAGSFERIAHDAPARLETWPCTVFRVRPVQLD